MEPFKNDYVALGTCRATLGSRENVVQSYLFLPRTQQTSDVPGMEAMKYLAVAVSHGHAYSYGSNSRGCA